MSPRIESKKTVVEPTQDYKKVETFNIITGTPIVKYLPLNRTSLNSLPIANNKVENIKRFEDERMRESTDPEYLLNKQKFFGISGAFQNPR